MPNPIRGIERTVHVTSHTLNEKLNPIRGIESPTPPARVLSRAAGNPIRGIERVRLEGNHLIIFFPESHQGN